MQDTFQLRSQLLQVLNTLKFDLVSYHLYVQYKFFCLLDISSTYVRFTFVELAYF